MNKHVSINLGEHFNAFIQTQIAEGRYETADDVIRASLQLLEEQETKLAALRAALDEGENSGPFEPFDFDEFIARKTKEKSAR